MNAAHLHLLINHFPIAGSIIGLGILLVARARRSSEINMMALWLFVVVALVGIPTYLSGPRGEHVVEHMPGVTEEQIAPHEQAALLALLAAAALGAMSLVALRELRATGQTSNRTNSIVLLIALISTALLSWTGLLGGQIRHTEARPGFVAPTESAEEGEE